MISPGALHPMHTTDKCQSDPASENRADLKGREAVEKIREFAENTGACFFCTASRDGLSGGARPMAVQQVDDLGNLWFLSADDSHKNEELLADPSVRLFFQGEGRAEFLVLTGRASVSKDREKIVELWKPIFKNWFPGGMSDPSITVIKVTPDEGHYWDTQHGNLVAGIKLLAGTLLGRPMDDSVHGALQV